MAVQLKTELPGIEKLMADRVRAFLAELVDQESARVLVRPYGNAPGYWFGGGSLLAGDKGDIYLVGRYRNAGDSRTGVGKGERGLELAIFMSTDGGTTFSKTRSWSKEDLSRSTGEVISIEGAALHRRTDGTIELYVSTEKARAYPDEAAAYQKPGTGVWSIDMMSGPTIDAIDLSSLRTVLAESDALGYLHVKDPVVFSNNVGATVLIACNHPFTWASANSGYALRAPESTVFELVTHELVSRGPAWDVAGTRITDRLTLPRVGALRGRPALSVYFYDGLECYRPHTEDARAVSRPRGWSCEELAGAFIGYDAAFPTMRRLSTNYPFFVSAWGTGCCRYIHTVSTNDGILATWQQSQTDRSQPLVGRFMPMERVEQLLS